MYASWHAGRQRNVGSMKNLDTRIFQSSRARKARKGRAANVAVTLLFLAGSTSMHLGCGGAQSAGDGTGRDTAAEEREADMATDEAAPLEIASPTRWSNGWFRLRAEAWPAAQSPDAWHALENGEGNFRCEGGSTAQTFVFASRESSALAQGIALDFGADLPAASLPRRVSVRISPTPIDVSRAAWPAVAATLRTVGVARIDAEPGQQVFLQFSQPERVSLLELDVRVSTEGAQCGMGRVALVPATLDAPLGDLVTFPLGDGNAPNAPEAAPQRTGILGIDGASPVPRSQN